MSARIRPLSVRVIAAACLSLSLIVPAVAAKKGVIRKPTLDPNAPVVKLFEGIDQGTFDVRVSARSEFEAKVFITNKTDKPQTVALPKAAAAVHVLKQFLPPNALAQNQLPGDAQRGGSQSVGVAFGDRLPGANGPLPGGNFFSIPPEQTVQIQVHSVCLDHGKPSPSAKKKYVLVRLEEHTSNRALRRLLEDYDPQKTDRMAMQAAAWHLANGMSFEQLKAKPKHRLGGGTSEPHFTKKQLEEAESLVETAKANAVPDVPLRSVTTKKL